MASATELATDDLTPSHDSSTNVLIQRYRQLCKEQP
jgi:hypothetical protein